MTHPGYLALFYWNFLPGSGRKVHVAGLRSQPVSELSTRDDEGLCGGAIRGIGQALDPRQHEQAVVAEKDAIITDLKDLITKLEGQVGQYRRAKFGPKSEKLDPANLELALEGAPLMRQWFEPNDERKPRSPKRRRRLPPSRKRSRPMRPTRTRLPHLCHAKRGRCLRISRDLGVDFARSWARVSRHRGQPFRGCGQAGRRFHGVRLDRSGQAVW